MEPNTKEHSPNLPEEADVEQLSQDEAAESAITDEGADALQTSDPEASAESSVSQTDESETAATSVSDEADAAESAVEETNAAEEEIKEESPLTEVEETEPPATEDNAESVENTAESTEDTPEDSTNQEEAEPKKRHSKFALGLLIGIAVFGIIAVGALITLWQFLKAYEITRPATTMNHFMETLDEAFWSELVENKLSGEALPFESREDIVKDTVSRIRSASYKYLLKSSETTEEKTVYRVLIGGKEVLTLTLIPSGEAVGFGLHEWTVDGYELNEKNLPLKQTTYTYTVPTNAILALNGVMVGANYVTKSDIPAPERSELEPSASCTMSTYKVSLYSEPQATVVLDNSVLSAEKEGYYPYPTSMWKSGFLVVAPTEATLSVNGVLLDKEKYGSGFAAYTGNSFEHTTGHTYTVYSLPAMFDTPVITAEMEGQTHTLTETNNTFSMDYPAYLKYTVNVTVPTGALVYINGIPVDPMYMTASAVPLASVVPFQNHISAVPSTDTYMVTGFFNQPQVTIALTGSLQTVSSLDETTRTITWIASRTADNSTLTQYTDLALNYTRTYMKLLADGYRNMYDNGQAVYNLMVYGTPSYKSITKIYSGLYYVIPSTLTYHNLEVTDILCHSDEVFECTVHYATSQKTGNVVVENSGTIQLLFLKKSGAWKVASFALSQNT